MGMFDISGTGTGKPMYAEDLYGAGANMLSDQLAPGMKRTFGYESPKRQAMAIAKKADLSSFDSVQQTYKELQQVNPDAAGAWLAEVTPVIKAKDAAKKAQLTARNTDTTRMKDIADIAKLKWGCDINDKSIGKDGMSCYDRSEDTWLQKRARTDEKVATKYGEKQVIDFSTYKDATFSRYDTANKQISAANRGLAIINDTQNPLYTGPGGEILKGLHAIGATLGFKASEIPAANAEAFISDNMTQITAWIQQTKGAISEKEMEAFAAASAGLTRTPLGNRLILNTIKRVAEYDMGLADALNDWEIAEEDKFNKDPSNIKFGRRFIPNKAKWEKRRRQYNTDHPLIFPTAQDLANALGTPRGSVKQMEGKTLQSGITIMEIK